MGTVLKVFCLFPAERNGLEVDFFQHPSKTTHDTTCHAQIPSQISASIYLSPLLMTGSYPSLFPQSQNKRVLRASGTPRVSCWGQPCVPVGERDPRRRGEARGVAGVGEVMFDGDQGLMRHAEDPHLKT